MIVSFYVHSQSFMTTSFMKIGGYDSAGFDKNLDYSSMQTVSNTSWALNLVGLDYKAVSTWDEDQYEEFNLIEKGVERQFVIDPSFPFIYIPNTDFAKLISDFRAFKEALEIDGFWDEKMVLN